MHKIKVKLHKSYLFKKFKMLMALKKYNESKQKVTQWGKCLQFICFQSICNTYIV